MGVILREAKDIRDAEESHETLRTHPCNACARAAHQMLEDAMGHPLNVAVDIHCQHGKEKRQNRFALIMTVIALLIGIAIGIGLNRFVFH
ncbi:MAG: hypothetical protein WC526_00580 [Patescibacteria group bacterium]